MNQDQGGQMLVSRVQQSSRKRPKTISREVCPHCDQSFNIKTLKRHRSINCKSDGTWIKDTDATDLEVLTESKRTARNCHKV